MTASKRAIAIIGTLICGAIPNVTSAAEAFDPERNDLSICSEKVTLPKPEPTINLKDFADALRGTWVLRKRSIQGVVIDTDSKYYFDFGQPRGNVLEGWGMMLDLGNLSSLDPLRLCAACLADASVGALWKVSVASDPAGANVHMKMDGDYLGSYGDFRKGVKATEAARFYRYGSAYLAGQLSSPAGGQGVVDDNWDRISLVNGVLTYTSCKSGYIDRFVKVSDKQPLVKGMQLAEAWPGIKESGVLVNPPRGEYQK